MDGQDKFALTLGDKTILDHIINRIEPQSGEIVINCNKELETRLGVFPDLKQSLGPLGGIFTALKIAQDKGLTHVITVPCDTPFLPDNLTSRLQKPLKPMVMASSNNRNHPVIAKWDVSLLKMIETALDNGELKLMKLIEKIDYAVSEWDEVMDPYFNINTPDDLKIAHKRI